MSGLIVKPYRVEVSGFPSMIYVAKSRGQALAKAWGDYTACYNTATFKEFMRLARARREDVPGFGRPIMVCGQPGFDVGTHGQYVRFVRPGADQVLLSHPADVQDGPA